MIRKIMHHHTFGFHGVFDEHTDNASVYAGAATDMVGLACQGTVATIMAYGQVCD